VRIYWYAPFQNAYELDVATHVARVDDHLIVQTLATRFGNTLPPRSSLDLRRDLPEPAGESRSPASGWRRAKVALVRAQGRAAAVKRDDFDIAHIHTYNMFTDWLALRLLRRRCRTIVLSVHNVRPHKRRAPRVIESWLHRVGYHACDHIIVADQVLQDQLVEDFRLPVSRISVIPLAIQPVPETNSAVASEPREFLFFGTFRHNKGIDELLTATRSLGRELDIVVRFAGRGEPDLEDLVRDAAASDPRVIAEIGWVHPDRQTQLFQKAWAVVLPYTSFDAQSGVLRDAYAYQVPVVVTDIGALGRSVRDDRSGWVVRPGDTEGLTGAMTSAALDVAKRAEYVESLKPLSATSTFEAIGIRTRSLYDEIHPCRPDR